MNETTYLPISNVMSESINNLCAVINDWATKKGWNEDESEMSQRQRLMHKGEMIALMHSELSECLEYLRQSKQPAMDDKVPTLTGEAAELADTLIRIFHYCGKYNIDLGRAIQLKHEYNTNRPYRHGKRN